MITANEANFRSINGKTIKEIEEKIETAINEATADGMFECSVSVSTNTNKEVRERIKAMLTELGYVVKITDYDKEYGNAPAEQRPWYDNISISWRK